MMNDKLEQLYIKLTERCNRLILVHNEGESIEEEIEVILEEISNEREMLLVEACSVNNKIKNYERYSEELDNKIEKLLRNNTVTID